MVALGAEKEKEKEKEKEEEEEEERGLGALGGAVVTLNVCRDNYIDCYDVFCLKNEHKKYGKAIEFKMLTSRDVGM